MTNDERLEAARAALAAAEAAARDGGGFLAEERRRVEATTAAGRSARTAARDARRVERAARRERSGEGGGARSDAPAVGSDLFAPERAAAQRRIGADRRRRGLAPAPDDDPAPGPLDSGPHEPPKRKPWERRSPFLAPEGAPDDVPDAMEVARQIVLRQLAMAPRSRAQLEEKLAAKECPPEVAAQVLDRMEQVGLVDDEEYAAMLVRSQVASRGLARRGLAHELRRKGIDAELADAALAQVAPDDERDTARALVDKKLRTMAALDRQVATRRLAGMLARKGYSPGLAYAVIREALDESPAFRRD